MIPTENRQRRLLQMTYNAEKVEFFGARMVRAAKRSEAV